MSNHVRKKILFVYKGGISEDFLLDKGFYPTEFLFGYHELKQEFDCEYIFLEKEPTETSIIYKLLYPVRKIFSYVTRLGLSLEIYFSHKKKLKEADVILCVNEAVSFGVLFYKMFGLISADVVVVVMSLQERYKYFAKNKMMLRFLSKLLSKADRLLTLSDYAQPPLIDIFRVPKKKIQTLYFGIDTDFWYPVESVQEEDFILAIGNDMNRDFQTLVDALPDDVSLKIITKKSVDTKGKKVEVFSSWLTNEEVREMYSKAKLIVVPSIELKNESSGLSCALQTLACRRPLIISDPPPIKEVLKDEVDCLFYNAGDAVDLRKKIQILIDDTEKRTSLAHYGYETVQRRFTAKQMSDRVAAILHS